MNDHFDLIFRSRRTDKQASINSKAFVEEALHYRSKSSAPYPNADALAPAPASHRFAAPRKDRLVRNGPPDAVKMMRSISSRRSITWNIALCSESVGTIAIPGVFLTRSDSTSGPAQTMLSLFASATELPASTAESVDGRSTKSQQSQPEPGQPDAAPACNDRRIASHTLRSRVPSEGVFERDLRAQDSSAMTTHVGANFRACSINRFALRPPVSVSMA